MSNSVPSTPCVAFVGLQHPHSLAILLSLQHVDAIRRLVVVEEDPSYQDKVDADATYTSLDEMFAVEKPLICFVMHPTDQAPGIAIRCIEHGCHVFIDKHCANTSSAMNRVIHTADKNRVKVSCGYLWRHHPITRDIKRLLRDGVIGDVWAWELRMVTTSIASRLAGAATMQGPVRPIGGSPWLFQRARSGGGILMWLACHLIDWIRYALETEVSEVIAFTAKRTQEDVDVEDVASVSFRMEDGSIGTLHAAYVTPGGMRSKDDTYIGIQGHRGDIRWSPGESPPTFRARSSDASWAPAGERTFTYDIPEAPGYGGANGIGFFKDFVLACIHDSKPIITGQDALRVLEIFEAVYQSAESGRAVKVRVMESLSAS